MTASVDAALPQQISPRARKGGLKAHERLIGLLFLLPALAAFTLVILYPFLRAIGTAFTRSNLQTPEPVFIGISNFVSILRDRQSVASTQHGRFDPCPKMPYSLTPSGRGQSVASTQHGRFDPCPTE